MLRNLTFGGRTLIMGIVNVTPDSFYARSRVPDARKALEQARSLLEEGADIVDIGGMSTRPGAEEITLDEELKRVLPVIEALRKESDAWISVDTYRAEVARGAIECGADIVNDISGLQLDNGLGSVVRDSGAYIILMHMRGTPRDMQSRAVYSDVVEEVSAELDRSIEKALTSGINRRRIIIDPGIGFSKTALHSLVLVNSLPFLKKKGYPLLVGLSRKSFLGSVTGLEPEERLIPTVAANAVAVFLGADIVRVHDVREGVITARVAEAIRRGRLENG